MNRFLASLTIIVLLFSCDSTRVYEDFVELPGGWSVNDTVTFELELEPNALPYKVTSQFRTDVSYPYSNLYYYFQIKNEQGAILHNELQEVDLFEVKTGKPMGSGLGDLYHVEDVSVNGLSLKEAGKFTISVIQYMRLDTLRGIDRIGLRVNAQESD